MSREEDFYPCEACGGTGRIPSHLLSLSSPTPPRPLSPAKQEWLHERRKVDVSKWVTTIGKDVELLEPFLKLVARVEYLESKLYDLLHGKGE